MYLRVAWQMLRWEEKECHKVITVYNLTVGSMLTPCESRGTFEPCVPSRIDSRTLVQSIRDIRFDVVHLILSWHWWGMCI
jgi:hypothetical protein